MLFLRSLGNFIDAYYFSNRNDREGRLAVDNQTFFFFFLPYGHRRTGVLAIATWAAWFWAAQGRLLSKKKKKKKERKGQKGCFNIFAMAGLRTQSTPAYGSKQSKYCFDQLKNCLTYLNFNTIFEILGQFTIKCIRYIIFQKGVDNSEIKHKTYLFLVRDVVSPEPNVLA